MSDSNGASSLIDNKMEVSVNTEIVKQCIIETTNDNEKSKENPLSKSMDCSSEFNETKSRGHPVPINSEMSNEPSDFSSLNNTPAETLNEQLITTEPLITMDNKNGNKTEKDNSMSIDNEVITVNESEFSNEHSKNKENNNFSLNETENSKSSENSKNEPDLYFIDNCSSLNAIAAEYDSSDSESENKNDNSAKVTNSNDSATEITNSNDSATKVTNFNDSPTKILNSNIYRNMDEVVITDSDSSDSESDSSSSESESETDNGCHKSSSDDSDEEKSKNTRGNKSTKSFKPKSEFDDLPPIEDLKISVPEVLCDPLGEVAWTVEQMVVVRPKPGKPTLNLDTVLFIEKGQRALGHIFDVFGQVAEPHYCVRFNSSDHIRECDIKVGMTVYYCPNTPYTSLVFLSELTKMKAIDDIGDDEAPQFSDDEEEQAYLASLKNAQNNRKVQESSGENPSKRKRVSKTGWQSNHPWNSNKDHQQNVQSHSSKPFYRSHHPWSRPRYQPHQWRPQHFYPNQWMGQYPAYNQMQSYNQYFTQAQTQQPPQGQWNPQYQLPPQALPLQGVPPTFVPPFNLPPPPPPPPPST